MIPSFEKDYKTLVELILHLGEERHTRNGMTKSSFGHSLWINNIESEFPLLLGRKLYYKGVLGELAAFFRGPTKVQDFKDFGCNYWDAWGDEDGNINVDYGNAWRDFNGVDQLMQLRETLLTNPTDRRMLVSGWRPDRLEQLSLPCCHYAYQFYVRQGKYLDMIWMQRSVDVMIGLPSDIILAAAWLIALAKDVDLVPGSIKMDFGDCHIYEEHFEGAKQYCENVELLQATYNKGPVSYNYTAPEIFTLFKPDNLEICNYQPMDPIKFELKV